MSDKIKIVITAPSLDPKKNVSGISTVVRNIIDYGNNQYLHYTLGSEDENKEKKTVKWFFKTVKSLLNFDKFLSNNQPDWVHINLPCDTKGILREFIIFRFSRKNKIKTLVHLHGGRFLMDKPSSPIILYCFNYILSHADKLIVLSDIEKEQVTKLYSCKNVKVLYNSIDIPENFKFYKRKENYIKLLFLGRIEESKGIEDIAEALNELSKERHIKFVLCGAGSMEEKMIKIFTESLGENFVFKGIVSGDEKNKVILDSDIFLLPSRYGEGLPMALLETMGTGIIPVVTTDASMKFVVSHEKNGIFVEKNNPQDLYLKLKNLIDNQEMMEQLSLNARKTIEDNFNIKDFIGKLEDMYNNN